MSEFFHTRVNEESYITHGVVYESSLTEGNGREWNGLTTPSQGVTTNLTTPTVGREPGSKSAKGSIPGLDGSVVERLLRNVELVPESGCWIFMGSLNRAGYGRVGIGSSNVYLAHRLTYAYFVEPLNDDVNVLHRCDIPCCCNPHHLFSGSQSENIDDMLKKGRGSKPPLHFGEKVHCAKLSADDVRAIRELLASGETGVSVAKRFGVSTSTISVIRQNKKWRHVA
jgi:hypothetical protein